MDSKKIYGNIIIFVLLGFYPLIMTNGYFNVSLTKYVVFGSITILMTFALVLDFCWKKQEKKEQNISDALIGKWKGLLICDKFVVGYLVAQLIAFFVSEDKYISFTGVTNKYMGLFTAILLVCLYFIVRCSKAHHVLLIATGEISSCLVVLIGLLQFCGIDFFGFLDAIKYNPVQNYISTIGNTGIFGLYLILIFPIAAGTFCTTQIKDLKILSGITVFILNIGLLISNTDSTFLGFGVCFFFLAYIYGTDNKYSVEFLRMLSLVMIAVVLLGIIFQLVPHRTLSQLSRFILSDQIAIPMLLLVFFAFMLKEKWCNNKRILFSIRIILIVVGIGLTVGVLMGMIYFSVFAKGSCPTVLEHYLQFDDEWGTGRGYVWIRLLRTFSEKPLIQKIFGVGQGMVLVDMITYYRDEMQQQLGYIYDNAHNVYIQYLYTIGIFGVAMYIGAMISAVVSGLKKNPEMLGCMLGIALTAYGVADIVSILQPITVPYIWLFMALISKE